MDQFERHARLDERVIHAEHVIGGAIAVSDARMGRSGLFRVQQRDAGERPFVAEIALVAVVPVIDAFDNRHPPAVIQHAGELRHPRPHPVRRPLGDPQLHLRLALDRILPAIRLLEADAENPADRTAAHDGAELLRAAAVRPRRRQAAPGLVVGELNLGELSRRLHVRRPVWNEPRVRADPADARVPVLPELGQTRSPPFEKEAVRRVAAVGRSRQRAPGGGLEVPLAVDAVTVAALRRPPVPEDPVDSVLGDDLPVHLVHELEVVGTERAGDPQIGIGPVAPGFARGGGGNPVGMRLPDVLARRMRVGSRDHVHAERAAAGDQRAERILVAKRVAAMVQRNLCRVVGDDPAGTERGGIGMQAAEVVQPELWIEAAGIVLDQRQLHPAHRPIEPAARRAGAGGLALIEGHRGSVHTRCESERPERAGRRRDVKELPSTDRLRHGRLADSCRYAPP